MPQVATSKMRRPGVTVDSHDNIRGLHTRQVLHRPGDTAGNIEGKTNNVTVS